MSGHFPLQPLHLVLHLMGVAEGRAQYVLDGHFGGVVGHLVDHAHRAPGADGYHAAVIVQPAGQNMQQGGLARAVWA